MASLFDDGSDDGDSLFGPKPTYVPKKDVPQESTIVLPNITSMPQPKPEPAKEIPKPQMQPVQELPQLQPPPPIQQTPAPQPEPVKPAPAAQPEPVVQHVETPAPKPKGKKVYTKSDVESSLTQFKNMIQQKFDELQLEIKTFNPPPLQYRHVCYSNEKLLQLVKSIVTESAHKERIINELQSQIDSLSSVFTEREERVNLRAKIAQLKNEVDEFSKPVDTAALNSSVKRLEDELNKITQDHKKFEQLEKDANENKIQVAKKNTEADITRLSAQLKQLETGKLSLEEQVSRLVEENEKFKKSAPPQNDAAAAQLKEAKAKLAAAAKGVVQKMAGGTLTMITRNVKEENKYPTATILQAVKTSLSYVADEILNPDDDDEEDEDEDYDE